MDKVEVYLKNKKKEIDDYILKLKDSYFKSLISNELWESLFYLINAGGKRLRSIFLIRTAEINNIPAEIYLPHAAAIEFFQTFTLIHDDLPALDNDDYRRGLQSLHRKFNEATAILAGDSLAIITFLFLSKPVLEFDKYIKGTMKFINIFAKKLGLNLIDAQLQDIKIIQRKSKIEVDDLEKKILDIYLNKTALFFGLSLSYGNILTGEQWKDVFEAGVNAGLSFQLKDDLKDYEEELTKGVNSYSVVFGVEKTKKLMNYYKEKSLSFFIDYDEIIYKIIERFF